MSIARHGKGHGKAEKNLLSPPSASGKKEKIEMETVNQKEETKEAGKAKGADKELREIQKSETGGQGVISTFEQDLDDEIVNANMFSKYVINANFISLMKAEPLVGTITKVAGFRGAEELVIRTTVLRWKKDIRTKTQADRDYIEFKGVNHKFTGTLGELVGNKSGKPYWGIRFALGNGDDINYALTYGDIRILTDLKVFRLRENA